MILNIRKFFGKASKWRKRGKFRKREESDEKSIEDETNVLLVDDKKTCRCLEESYGSNENLSASTTNEQQECVTGDRYHVSGNSSDGQIVPAMHTYSDGNHDIVPMTNSVSGENFDGMIVHPYTCDQSINNIASLKEATVQYGEGKGTHLNISLNLNVMGDGPSQTLIVKDFDGRTLEISKSVSVCKCERLHTGNRHIEGSNTQRACEQESSCHREHSSDTGACIEQFQNPNICIAYPISNTEHDDMVENRGIQSESRSDSCTSKICSSDKQFEDSNTSSTCHVSSIKEAHVETIRSNKTEFRNENSLSLQSASSSDADTSSDVHYSEVTSAHYLDIHESRTTSNNINSLDQNKESSRGNLIGLRTERQRPDLTETIGQTSELTGNSDKPSDNSRNDTNDSNSNETGMNGQCQTHSENGQSHILSTIPKEFHRSVSNLSLLATNLKQLSDGWSVIDDSSDDGNDDDYDDYSDTDDDSDTDNGRNIHGHSESDDDTNHDEEEIGVVNEDTERTEDNSSVYCEEFTEECHNSTQRTPLRLQQSVFNIADMLPILAYLTPKSELMTFKNELQTSDLAVKRNFFPRSGALPFKEEQFELEILLGDCLIDLRALFVLEFHTVCYNRAREVIILTKFAKHSRGSTVPLTISVIEIGCNFTQSPSEANQFLEYKKEDVYSKTHEEHCKPDPFASRFLTFLHRKEEIDGFSTDFLDSIGKYTLIYHMESSGLLYSSVQQVEKYFAQKDNMDKTERQALLRFSSCEPIKDIHLWRSEFFDVHNGSAIFNDNSFLHTMPIERKSESMEASKLSSNKNKCNPSNTNLNVCLMTSNCTSTARKTSLISEMQLPGVKNQHLLSERKSVRSNKRTSSTIKRADRQYLQSNSQISKGSNKSVLEIRVQGCNSTAPELSPGQSLLSAECRSIGKRSKPLTLCIKLQDKRGRKSLIRKEVCPKVELKIQKNIERSCLHRKNASKGHSISDLKLKLKDISIEDLLYILQNSVTNARKSLEFLRRPLRISSSQRIISVYPITEPRTGLDGYFQRVLEGEEMTYRDKMQYEWLRIQSFWSFPINVGMSMIYLARNGFYYTGRSTECRCYFCGHTYNDWEATDNNSERIIEIHRRISPNCVFLTGSSHNNVPIHQESPVSFAFGAPPPREPRTAIEGSVPSPPGATSEATGLSDHAQASASAALLPNFPATSLHAPSMSTSGQANSVSSAPVSAQSSTATAATTNQPLAPSVTASSSSGLPSTSQPTASQSGATFLVEPSPTISMPPASHSSGQGSSDPLQHAKPLPQRDKSQSPEQQSHDNQQGSGAPSFIPTIPSQASAVIPDPVPRASDEASGHMKPRESTLPGAQSSAGRRNTDRRQADDTQVVSRSSNVTSSTPRVVYRITLHLSSFHYTEELSDPNNPEFLRISGQITPVLEHLFQSIAGDQRINIIRFIPNPPVLIVFDLESYYFSDEAVLRSVFDQAIQKGSIAVYRISPEGFEFRLTEESNLQVESATGQQQQALSAPATSAPATSVPATSVPVTSVPATSVSATSAPATSASATSAPATSAAATSALATNQAASSASGQQNAPETGRQRMGTSTTAPPRPQRFDPLGINFDRPRYPAYAVLTVRNGSYSDWPTSLTQEPLDMALAGFFYAGYGDYVRCFFCGGGLRNWDDGDDPWVEHAKWFPRCAFVRQNKGEKFVNDIQRRHHEQGAGIEFEEEIEEQIPDEELPAYRSLIEMNYSPETVQRAIETFRQRIRPGRQAPLPMSATNLADIIFEFENGNSNSDIAEVRQSEGEEVERTTEGVRSASHATEGMRTEPPAIEELRTEPPATEGVKTSSPATEDVRIESPSETTPSDVAESGRISEEERRAEQTKLLDEASALESTSSQEGEGDLETLKEENISLKEKLKCKVCLEKDVAVAFLPCGHLVCCTDCAPAIRICIICNEMVKGTVKTFFP